MKRILIAFFLISTWAAKATPLPEVFQEPPLPTELSVLTQIEEHVSETGQTLAALEAEDAAILNGLKLQSQQQVSMAVSYSEMPVLEPFWWGCCLGPIGIVATYLITENNSSDVKNAALGCLVWALLGGGCWGVFGNRL